MRSSGTYSYYINNDLKLTTTENSYTFDDLSQSVQYSLKVVIRDNAGNETEKEITATTNTVPSLSAGGNIIFGYDPGEGWTNDDVHVTLTTKDIPQKDEFTLQYLKSVNQTDWEDYTDAGIVMEQNGSIFARLVDAKGQTAGTATGNVANIDKANPGASLSVSDTTTHSFTINVDAEDFGGSELRDTETYSYYKNGTLMTKTTEASYTYNDLKQGTAFTLKVEIRDNAGNVTTQELNTSTRSIPGLNITSDLNMDYAPKGWTASDVKVTLTNVSTDEFTLQYRVGTGGTWYNYNDDDRITVERNNAVYARLIDETGQTGGMATGNITNIDKDKPTASLSQSHDTNSVTINVSANDGSGSGLANTARYKYYKDNVLQNTSTTSNYRFSGLSDYTSYTFKVEITDNVGNMETKTLTQRTQCTGTHSNCTDPYDYQDYRCQYENRCFNAEHYGCSDSTHYAKSHSTYSGGTCPQVTGRDPSGFYCSVCQGVYTSKHYHCSSTAHKLSYKTTSGTCSVQVSVTKYKCSKCGTIKDSSFSHYRCSISGHSPSCSTSSGTCNASYQSTHAATGWGYTPGAYQGAKCEVCGTTSGIVYAFARCPSCGVDIWGKFLCGSCYTTWRETHSVSSYKHTCTSTCKQTKTNYVNSYSDTKACGNQLQNKSSQNYVDHICGNPKRSISIRDKHYVACRHGKTSDHWYCSHNSNGVPHD